MTKPANNKEYRSIISDRYNEALQLINAEKALMEKVKLPKDFVLANLAFLLPNSRSKWGTLWLIVSKSKNEEYSLAQLQWLNRHAYKSNYTCSYNKNGVLRLYQDARAKRSEVKRYKAAEENRVYNKCVELERTDPKDNAKHRFAYQCLSLDGCTLLGNHRNHTAARAYATQIANGTLTYASDPTTHRRAIRLLRKLANSFLGQYENLDGILSAE